MNNINDENDSLKLNNLGFSRFGVYMESDEESSDDDEDKDIGEMLDDIEELGAEDDNPLDEEDEEDDDEYEDTEELGVDDKNIQNEYKEEELEILNGLIADEQHAASRYFEGAKNTNDEFLRRLYSDIGSEEVFHSEQLLFAKSELTGDNYEPQDPKVREEYDELLSMGMDTESAAFTAIDKVSMSFNDDGDMDSLEQEMAVIESAMVNNEILTSILYEEYSKEKLNHSYKVFYEMFVMEEMTNVAQAPKDVTKINSPLKLLMKGLRASIQGLIRMSEITRDAIKKNKVKRHARHEWIKNHGIADLFKSGIDLYFYNDKTSRYEFEQPVKYVDLLYRLTKAAGLEVGIKLTDAAKREPVRNGIGFNSVDDGIAKLKGVILTKTKVVVTDKNKDAIAADLFGYNTNKINVKVQHSNDPNATPVNDSDNIYNRLSAIALVTAEYSKISESMLSQLSKFEGDTNSIYYKDRSKYNKAVNIIKFICEKYNEFTKAMAHDLNVMIKLDNELIQLTRKRDEVEQSGGTWTGDDVRTRNSYTQPSNGTRHTKPMK